LNKSHAKIFIKHSIHQRIEHARKVAQPRENKINERLMLGQERLNKVFVQGRKCVEHKKWTPQSYEYGEHDDEYS
jgi:hypothetical protein